MRWQKLVKERILLFQLAKLIFQYVNLSIGSFKMGLKLVLKVSFEESSRIYMMRPHFSCDVVELFDILHGEIGRLLVVDGLVPFEPCVLRIHFRRSPLIFLWDKDA